MNHASSLQKRDYVLRLNDIAVKPLVQKRQLLPYTVVRADIVFLRNSKLFYLLF